MKAQFTTFGAIEIASRRYDHDVVIDGGQIRKRIKKASKAHRAAYGHSPLSLEENLPWSGQSLLVGTGMYGRLPVMPEVEQETRRRPVRRVVVLTEEACPLLADHKDQDIHAVLQVTS